MFMVFIHVICEINSYCRTNGEQFSDLITKCAFNYKY